MADEAVVEVSELVPKLISYVACIAPPVSRSKAIFMAFLTPLHVTHAIVPPTGQILVGREPSDPAFVEAISTDGQAALEAFASTAGNILLVEGWVVDGVSSFQFLNEVRGFGGSRPLRATVALLKSVHDLDARAPIASQLQVVSFGMGSGDDASALYSTLQRYTRHWLGPVVRECALSVGAADDGSELQTRVRELESALGRSLNVSMGCAVPCHPWLCGRVRRSACAASRPVSR